MNAPSTAIAARDQGETLPAEPASETAAILSVIERAARDPNVDIEKMERLFGMRERMLAQAARSAYYAALSEMQPKLPVVERRGLISVPAKDGKTGHETPYALWEDINEAIRPLLSEHGFALSFRIKKDADRVEVTGVLSHRGGHADETTLSLPMDATGSKNNVQAIGSSVSYGKRYTAMALLNITSRGEDDNGAKAPGGFVTDEQAEELRKLAADVGADVPKFCRYMKIDAIPDLLAKDFDRALAALEAKRVKR
jgi:hypothetical protein